MRGSSLFSRGVTLARAGTVAAVSLTALVVAAVGVVAFVAELQKTWEWYFLMERTIALATPVALVLVSVSVIACFCLIAVTAGD